MFMQSREAIFAQVISAIGEPHFAETTADALRSLVNFDLTAVVLHPSEAQPAVVFDNFGAREGLENYVQVTHQINPILAEAPQMNVVRARDFGRTPRRPPAALADYMVPAPEEELGFRTIGWPPGLEEVGLYFQGCGGIVEVGFYRERSRRVAPASTLRALRELISPVAAAFERHYALERRRGPADAAAQRLASLSPREREICDLLLIGCSTEAIALRLEISRYTVKDHRKKIFRKLEISSLQELFALRH